MIYFPVSGLSVSITGFKGNDFVYLRLFFLGRLIKQTMTHLVVTQHRLDGFDIYITCYLFLHSREHVRIKCLWVYLDRAFAECRVTNKQTNKESLRDLLHYCMSIVVMYYFQSHTTDYRVSPHHYCGIIKD